MWGELVLWAKRRIPFEVTGWETPIESAGSVV
jgi:hypothetical protein